jgi:hypothetical protein
MASVLTLSKETILQVIDLNVLGILVLGLFLLVLI